MLRSLEPSKIGGDVVGKVVCGGSHSGMERHLLNADCVYSFRLTGVLLSRTRRIYMWGLK